MQTKVIIGTIAFMLTMIILGFATLLEPARLQETTLAFEGRQIEKGAVLFQNNCSTCHGIEGKAAQCFDPSSGEPTGCIGLPLNNADLLCGDPSPRMTSLDWRGTKRNLILQTISAGRAGTQMPTWSQEFGGPMETYQLNQVTNFVMNWGENEELCAVPTREPVVWPDSVSELPEGDAANGEGLYTSFGCVGCHGDPAVEGSNGVGPWLGNISVVGAQRIEGLDDAHQYVYESILNPGDFLAPECPPNGDACPNGMPPNFGDRMTLQEMADIIAYITSFEN